MASEDRRIRALKDAQKREENKRCADCTERLPNYIVLDFKTFVCTACSGIHREFSHRIKSVSLANFTDDEVRAIRKGGNRASNDLWLAKYDPDRDLPEPDGSSVEKRREFIRMKYQEKRWYATTEDLAREAEEQARRASARARNEEAR
ncbi:putative GTPase activating protein for Arf-domain-containing protein [Tribonema minus]|uniref:Putative GTPase activating protein for Arf-domain-containing protein n=1 Tax=Tribonema minus TaxID=303371 RepID=A0A836C8Y8_9STRA|nr:putative GTPase activating protein for Arf-domain-containing protein [Tribonema minus]